MAIINWNGPEAEIAQDRLNHEAEFSLHGHELVDPAEERGYVSRVDQIEAISMAGKELPAGVRLYEIGVVDPFVAADPETYDLVSEHVAKLEDLIHREYYDPLIERQKEHPYMREGDIAVGADGMNRFTEAWLAGSNLAPLKAWHSMVPTAEALGYLTDPCVNCSIVDSEGGIFTSTPETAAHLRFVDDAVAIRDRAVAMEEIAKKFLASKVRGSKARWLSLASGTGEPSIAASKHAADTNDLDIELVVADINPKSLNYVKGVAQKYGFDAKLTTVFANILDDTFIGRLAKKTGTDEKYTVVENMGFEEYLPQDGDELGAYRDIGLTQASDFTKMAYDLVEPGGTLISGNMVLDRPQRDFVFGIVNWPIINARSEESILNIYQKAGIPMEQIKMYRVKDELTGSHLYNIVEVHKPPAMDIYRPSKMARDLLGRTVDRDANPAGIYRPSKMARDLLGRE